MGKAHDSPRRSITDVFFDIELLFGSVMQWLHEDGFIRFERVGAHIYEYYGVTLTLKAMAAMRKVPTPF